MSDELIFPLACENPKCNSILKIPLKDIKDGSEFKCDKCPSVMVVNTTGGDGEELVNGLEQLKNLL